MWPIFPEFTLLEVIICFFDYFWFMIFLAFKIMWFFFLLYKAIWPTRFGLNFTPKNDHRIEFLFLSLFFCFQAFPPLTISTLIAPDLSCVKGTCKLEPLTELWQWRSEKNINLSVSQFYATFCFTLCFPSITVQRKKAPLANIG